jgi:hypothetical protein
MQVARKMVTHVPDTKMELRWANGEGREENGPIRATVLFFLTRGKQNCEKRWPISGSLGMGSEKPALFFFHKPKQTSVVPGGSNCFAHGHNLSFLQGVHNTTPLVP